MSYLAKLRQMRQMDEENKMQTPTRWMKGPIVDFPLCPIVVSKKLEYNWELCEDVGEYLVQGTLMCREHAMHSEVQKSFLSVCGLDGLHSHVIRQGQRRCLCQDRIKA